MSKIGHYDWIVDFDEIKEVIASEIGYDLSSQRAIVCGCGTSVTSELLLKHFNLNQIVSVDNDEECIRHMQELNSGNERMEWIVCDLVDAEDVGKSSLLSSAAGEYDIVFDKGTLDAILVGGTIYQYLSVVYNFMKTGSVFILCSLHDAEFLSPILESTEFNCSTTFYPLENGNRKGCIAFCRKISNKALDTTALQFLEERTMDEHFKLEDPLFPEGLKYTIRDRFRRSSSNRLSIIEAFHAIFADLSHLGYTFELFQSDLSTFTLINEGEMAEEEAIAFMETMQ